MHKALIIMVAYNSDSSVLNYLEVLNRICADNCHVKLVLVDNTERAHSHDLFERINDLYSDVTCIKTQRNIGYFPAVKLGYEMLCPDRCEYDWVVVSNVDIEYVSNDIFDILKNVTNESTAVVAPKIISSITKMNKNPKIISRYKKYRILLHILLTTNYIIFNTYMHIMNYAKRFRRKCITLKRERLRTIYAAHGSFMIFTDKYFEKGGNFDYPVFLFNEEIYVAETVNNIGLEVLYCPDIVVCDVEHVSTGRTKSKHMVKAMHNSSKYILHTYY